MTYYIFKIKHSFFLQPSAFLPSIDHAGAVRIIEFLDLQRKSEGIEKWDTFWNWDTFQGALILDRRLWVKKLPIGWIFWAQTAFAWTTIEIVVRSLDPVLWQEYNSDGKAGPKRQRSPETTTDTQGVSKLY